MTRTTTTEPDDRTLWRLWRQAAVKPELDGAIVALYDQLDAAIRARGPTCWTSGKCCNFDAYGHRLYVTGLEIAWVLWRTQGTTPQHEPKHADNRSLPILTPSPPRPLTPSCPYQLDKLCSIHAHRPMGCRVFFCQSGTEEWQRELYETFLARLRALHETHGVPYRYMEWRAGLIAAQS